MMKRSKLLLIMLLILSSVLFSSFAESEDPPAFFNISLLSLNTSSARCRCQFTLLYENQFPDIGIGIDFHESTVTTIFRSKTFDFPVETNNGEIPTYDEGGFDICFFDISWDLDWNPFGMFDTPSFLPYGENICQFSNSTYDSKLIEYLEELDLSNRTLHAKELQTILYENLPMITSHYVNGIYGKRTSIEGVDSTLLTVGEHNPEFWRNDITRNITFAVPWKIGNTSSFRDSAYNYFLSPIQYQDSLWLKAVYGSLFRRSPTTHLYEPCLARNYTFASDRRSITIDLEPSAKFSNGHIVNASDVKYTYDLLKTPALKLLCYCNPYIDYINDTEVVDNDTIKFNFKTKVTYLLMSCIDNIFKLLSFGIIEQSVVEPLISSYGYDIFREIPFFGNVTDQLVTSCGPFKMASYDYNNSIVELIPNEYWFGEGPFIDNLSFKYISGKDTAVASLLSGEVDILEQSYFPAWQDFEPTSIEAFFAGAFISSEIVVNLKHPILGTGELSPLGNTEAALNIRKAISHTVPRDLIVKEIFEGFGYPGVTSLPYSCVGFNEELKPLEYNITLAKEYMEKAGYEYPIETEKTGDLKILCLHLVSLAIIPLFRKKAK